MPSQSKLNKDIAEEREKVSFNVEEFTNWYHRGADKVEEKRFLGNCVKAISSRIGSLLIKMIFFLQKTFSFLIPSSKTTFQSAF